MTKRFLLPPDAIRQNLAPGRGSCIASDMITVQGAMVGYLYREEPNTTLDSGWRFFAGSEPEEYCDNPAHFAIYDVNTIANYDPEIVALLDAPIGSAFERDSWSERFRSCRAPNPEE